MTMRQETPDEKIVCECILPEPPEKVWKALTVPEVLARWMMPNDIEPEAGRSFSFAGTDGTAPVECEIMDVEAGRLLRYAWRERAANDGEATSVLFESMVTFELDRTAAGGTHLRVVHDGFAMRKPAVAISGVRCSLGPDAGAGGRLQAAANTQNLLRAA